LKSNWRVVSHFVNAKPHTLISVQTSVPTGERDKIRHKKTAFVLECCYVILAERERGGVFLMPGFDGESGSDRNQT